MFKISAFLIIFLILKLSSVNSVCVDTSTHCAGWVKNGFCKSSNYKQAQVLKYCAKSCNLCETSTSSTSASSSTSPTSSTTSATSVCKDTEENCAEWIANDFCTSDFYIDAEKLAQCGKTCGLC
ncbi:unnamed protein product [Caenorhabditis angaria]|uniref:ShKT domain-containing protein n=1 Tax=Caenorhabditis angaria TaxID=860376 RepID=A0A9P1IUJ7_9PELO|nr:unnamed protein product [Caenorhabditis angaria]